MMDMYRRMQRIRHFEEQVRELYKQGIMPGLAHLYIGEEAVAVGVCMALREDDYVTSTHRGHGHIIAKGGQLDRMMAEILGKAPGYNRGKGGSMHIADVSLGILGANGIVGGSFGIAAGAALSSIMQQTGRVTVCFFGEGAMNEGLFFEVANLTALWRLPVLFLCENNQYGQYSAHLRTTAGEGLALRARAFGIPDAAVDGQDVLAVYEATVVAVAHCRSGQGPYFIEAKTYRYGGHHVGDAGTAYRTEGELASWRARDPIQLYRQELLSRKLCSAPDLAAIDEQVQREVGAAVAFAKGAPFPSASEVEQDVYA